MAGYGGVAEEGEDEGRDEGGRGGEAGSGDVSLRRRR